MAQYQFAPRTVGRRPTSPTRRLGTWKLAYADFLTALCAFFLVMWIVHGVTAEDKAVLAEQFGQEAVAADQPTDFVSRIKATPALQAFGDQVRVSQDRRSIRIDLVDGESAPLFDTGDGALNTTGLSLLKAVGGAVAPLKANIRLEGHTDSRPLNSGSYSNWELSSDRAHAARRELIEAGIEADRIIAVTGLADTRPLLPQSPHLPVNRRISIVLSLAGSSDET